MGSHCECPSLGGVLRPEWDCGRCWNPKEEPADLTTECGGRGRISQEEPQVPGLGNWKEELSLQTDKEMRERSIGCARLPGWEEGQEGAGHGDLGECRPWCMEAAVPSMRRSCWPPGWDQLCASHAGLPGTLPPWLPLFQQE